MQTKAVLLSLILAAVGTRAAPAIEARQRTSIPLGIYTGSGCNDQGANTQPWSVVNVPTDGQCHSVSVVISGFVDSGRVDITPENPDPLPAGCSLRLYNSVDCTTQPGNTVDITGESQCRTFGQNNPVSSFIRSVMTVGNCAV